MNKILMLVEDYFRDEEVIYPYYRFQEAGYEVITVGPEKEKEYYGKFGIPITADISPQEADLSQVAAVIIPGGNAPDKMRINKGMVNLIKEAYRKKKIIAAVCHGGWMLVEADIIKGIKVTGYIAIATDLKNAGGHYLDQEVVVDDNIITSRKPADLPAFCKSILQLIQS
ncbi:MAG: type 1 glutamine amidotransferase domain-containing protein [Actinomycetota bacterium]|nr:type 1 glutamine amidotransferase domain-containing protein [Actinomycetota bacterium]